MENIACKPSKDYELIGGVKFFMAAASPFINHAITISALVTIFNNYILNNKIEAVVMSEMDVYLSEKDHYRPDVVVVSDFEKVKNGKRVYGAPDLVVEVLSRRTMFNDMGPKKAAYEACGVKEYWIIDTWAKRVEVYQLIDGKFVLSGVHTSEYDEDDDEGEEVPDFPIDKIKVSIFDDLTVDVKDIFRWYIETPVKEK